MQNDTAETSPVSSVESSVAREPTQSTDLLHELWDDEGRPTYERSKPSWLKQVRTDIDNSMNFQDVYNQATWELDCLEAGDPYEG